jgi:hypothetical protein
MIPLTGSCGLACKKGRPAKASFGDHTSRVTPPGELKFTKYKTGLASHSMGRAQRQKLCIHTGLANHFQDLIKNDSASTPLLYKIWIGLRNLQGLSVVTDPLVLC